MKGKILTIIISAAMMLTLCSSCKDRSNAETGETEITTASETTAAEPSATETTAAETSAAETTADEPVQDEEYVIFGHYEQDGDESNGPEPIEWLVLSHEDDRMLLISRNILDYQAYNTEYAPVTWETCTLRQWLNEDFINAAFDASEQERILTVTNTNPDNAMYGGTEGGNDTEDKVFLLSRDEADTLFADDEARAVDNCDWWWLRSPGFKSTHAAIVLNIGEIYYHGHIVSFNYFDHAVRPALWLKVDQ